MKQHASLHSQLNLLAESDPLIDLALQEGLVFAQPISTASANFKVAI
jgi:hypothetical protein